MFQRSFSASPPTEIGRTRKIQHRSASMLQRVPMTHTPLEEFHSPVAGIHHCTPCHLVVITAMFTPTLCLPTPRALNGLHTLVVCLLH